MGTSQLDPVAFAQGRDGKCVCGSRKFWVKAIKRVDESVEFGEGGISVGETGAVQHLHWEDGPLTCVACGAANTGMTATRLRQAG